MGITTPVIDRARADILGIDVVPTLTSGYASPVPDADVIAICIGCGRGLSDQDAVVECECWSKALTATLPCVMCRTCWKETNDELV